MIDTHDTPTLGLSDEKRARLRAAIDWLDANPAANASQIDLVSDTIVINHYGIDGAASLAAVARELGGKWDKDASTDLFKLSQQVADGVVYKLIAWRERVCTPVVTSTREVEVEEPDPDAVAALPKVKRTETVEEVEWRCEPLLTGRRA